MSAAADRVLVTWEGAGEPIVLALYGPEGELAAVPLLTKRALAYVCEKRGLSLADDLHERLIEADLLLPPYPEVPAALARLVARFDLYVLSMGSPWMIEVSQKNAGVEQHFKKIISVEPHKVYKPSSRAYTIGAQEIGLPKAQIGFVSSNSFDVMGSANFGFPTAWVNRTGEPLDKLGPVPDLVIPPLPSPSERPQPV